MPAPIQSLSHLSTLKSTITTVQELSSRVLALQRWQEAGVAGGNLALADLNIDTFNVAGPQAKGLYFDGVNKLSMSAADATHPGGISLGAQVIPGAKTFPALITASLGVTSGAATLPLYSTLGAGASDVLVKLGSSVADGSVNASAKLVSIRTGIGGTEAEYAYFSKNFLSLGGASPNSGKNAFAAIRGNSIWEFSQGAANLTPTFDLRNTAGKACGLLTGTSWSAFFFEYTGPFYIIAETRANIDAGNAGTGPAKMQVNDSGVVSAAIFNCGSATGAATGALQSSGEYENLVNDGGIILKSSGGTRYRTQNTNPGGITVTNIATATVTTSVIGTNTGDITLAAFGTTPNANGATLTGQVLNLEPASISRPGGVSTVAQVFSGVKTMHVEGNNTTLATLSSNELQIESSKGTPQVPVLKLISFTTPVAQFYSSTTGAAVVEGLLSLALIAGGTTALTAASTGNVTITGAVTASNLSGTNTGDVTIGAFSATPSSVGATLTVPQIINLTAADATNPGGVSINAQTFGGVKTADGWTGTNANTSTTIGALAAQLRAVATGASGIPIVEFVGNGTTRGIIFGGTTGNFGYNAVGGSHVFFNNGTSIAAITPTEARPATAGGLDLGTSSLQWNNSYLTTISLKGTINGTAGTSATANNAAGRNVLSSGSTTYTITNSLVTANSIILVTVNSTGQTTSSTVRAVPAAGSFTVVFSSAVTANTTFSWFVLTAF